MAPHRVSKFVFGPSPDGSFVLCALELPDGPLDFAIPAEDIETFAKTLVLAWHVCAEIQADPDAPIDKLHN